jgi:hypothetical protein
MRGEMNELKSDIRYNMNYKKKYMYKGTENAAVRGEKRERLTNSDIANNNTACTHNCVSWHKRGTKIQINK